VISVTGPLGGIEPSGVAVAPHASSADPAERIGRASPASRLTQRITHLIEGPEGQDGTPAAG
jgi:hypothetical protein